MSEEMRRALNLTQELMVLAGYEWCLICLKWVPGRDAKCCPLH